MDPINIETSRKALLQRKDEIEHLIDEMEKDSLSVSQADSISELSSYDNHPADIGDETFERSKDIALRENAQLEAKRIEEALQAIQEGTYGICSICGKEIQGERLAVMPEAVTCAVCSKESEAGDKMARPIEEDVINSPFNIQSLQDFQDYAQNQTIYDGEDAWQDVARFGTSDGPQDQPDARQYPNIFVDADEDRGSVEDVDSIPYHRDKDGMIYADE